MALGELNTLPWECEFLKSGPAALQNHGGRDRIRTYDLYLRSLVRSHVNRKELKIWEKNIISSFEYCCCTVQYVLQEGCLIF